MKTYSIPHTDLTVSRIAFGCMRIGGSWDATPPTPEIEAAAYDTIEASLDCGINFFDHADIYTSGKSEEIFGRWLKAHPGARDKMVVQSKAGIRFPGAAGVPARFDFSYEHIMRSTEGILKRLQTDHLDLLLLHRPDALVEPAEVAKAFDELQNSGKVRHFGVSNHTPFQIELLRRYVRQPLVVNQLELSLAQPALVVEGLIANRAGSVSVLGDGLLDYCRLHDILVQAWSPVGGGKLLKPSAKEGDPLSAAAELIADMAKAKGTTVDAIVLAWILRHPAGIQPIIGTTKADRVRSSALADDLELSREEWYLLLETARGQRVP